jgi:phosphodiesterase/alkaline phosphatase D-like protein
MTDLLLGPLLRHVDATSATIWVETGGPCEVRVAEAAARTFEVSGHHYALVVLTGLEPGRSKPYEVRLDGDVVWPEPDSDLPPSRIRTLAPGDPRFRLVFGSCRKPREQDALGPDALAAYAHRMARLDEAEWPESLLLLGDQVYADETTDATQEWLAGRRDTNEPPGTEVADFEEFCHLYAEAWCDPSVRWLLSTVPTSMIFDDHDVRDDWNTSHAWREQMAATSWWPERIRGALVSYWVYQHLGNLGPDELATNELYQQVSKSGEDNAERLRAFADHADEEADGAKGTRWSYRRDFGPVRLLVIDSRAGRILEGGERSMIGDAEFEWIEEQAAGGFDHLLIGTSLPWLLPNALAAAQSVNERACARPGLRGRVSEWFRQLADLEHWPSFRDSFDRLARLIARVAGEGAASVNVLSGDVHHAYVARARFPAETAAPVHQLTCSPVHNTVPWYMNRLFRAGWSRPLTKVSEWRARRAGVPDAPLTWSCVSGPHFGNAVMSVDVDGRTATATLLQPDGDTLADGPSVRLT